ncbi:hypothetical protein M758_12G033000 [Ceratodon purpureus]|nr:hypothetical protein M758_12G033000 [Ceratodon purpureus]
MDVYFELAQGSSMRLCLNLEEQFPDLRGWQLELMNYLCLVAYESEIYDGVCEDAWLRTTIVVEGDSNPVFSEESPEHSLLAEMAGITTSKHTGLSEWARVAYWRRLQERQSDLTARIKIHSNILPREAYRQKLFQEQVHQSFWTKLQSLIRDSSCFVNKRWFYPSRVLAEAVEEDRSLKEKMQEWSKTGGTCVLAMHLRRSNVPHAKPRNRLRDVELADVKLTTEKLGEGGEGSVYKVSWRNGTYAWKSFDHGTFERECEIALRILHPHVVHPFGRTSDVDGNQKCLLMEVLSEDLSRFAVEKKRCDTFDRCPLFSRVDTLDVLRQIASAIQFLHSRNVVHGDLKPSNILISHFEISDNSRHFLAKITDFGNAQFIVSGESFKPGGPGTTRYAAPEVLQWRRNAGVPFLYPKKSDVYSFGVVAFEVLTGHAVYNGHLSVLDITRIIKGELKPSDCIEWLSMRRRYPAEMILCLERCWELDPSKRPSFLELCEVLQRSKSKMQLLERRAVDLWNFLAVCFSAFVIVFIALWLQRSASGLWFS